MHLYYRLMKVRDLDTQVEKNYIVPDENSDTSAC